jgi:hypothetical protein
MFRSLFHDHLQESSFVLSAFTIYQLPASSFVFFGFVAVCPLFVCVSGVAVCVCCLVVSRPPKELWAVVRFNLFHKEVQSCYGELNVLVSEMDG